MSVSTEPKGKPGRRSLTADLNLVPYIDLLTCMIAFLLITAVWTQLAQLKTSRRLPGPEGEQPPPATRISLLVGQDGVNVMVNADRELVPDRNGQADWVTLGNLLKTLKGRYPDLDDVQIASEDSVLFDRLTGVMDATIAAGFPGVSVVPGNEAGL
ncbi:MAG: biopolymer transporter ExbD [Deltaproteobacteria bacterium]|nr:biopolymer transporter ExbD [Deltaproteobacteria bacterium]